MYESHSCYLSRSLSPDTNSFTSFVPSSSNHRPQRPLSRSITTATVRDLGHEAEVTNHKGNRIIASSPAPFSLPSQSKHTSQRIVQEDPSYPADEGGKINHQYSPPSIVDGRAQDPEPGICYSAQAVSHTPSSHSETILGGIKIQKVQRRTVQGSGSAPEDGDLYCITGPITSALPAHSQHRTAPAQEPAAKASTVGDWLTTIIQSDAPRWQPQTPPQQTVKRKRSKSVQEKDYKAIGLAHLPVTYDALKLHLASMASHDEGYVSGVTQTPKTPAGSSTSHRCSESTPSTNDEEKLTAAQLKKKPQVVQKLLEKHGMLKNSGDIDKPEHADFKNMVHKVVEWDRPSGARERSAQIFKEEATFSQKGNEATMLDALFKVIIKHERRVYKDGSTDYETVDFREEGVYRATDRQFTRGHVPVQDAGLGDKVAQALAKGDGISNPQPGYVYAIRDTQFPLPKGVAVRQSIQSILDVAGPSAGLYAPFFIVEGKNDPGLGQCENQACRAGSAVVNANRSLLERLAYEDKVGADDRTFIYSVTMNRSVMDFWIHWAEVEEDALGNRSTWFHMDHILSQAIYGPGALTILRRVCHNILEWGCSLERRVAVNKWFADLYDQEKKVADAIIKARQDTASKTPDRKRTRPNDPCGGSV